MASAEALYNSIKSGGTKLTDLNDEGKNALRSYMDNLPSQSTPSAGKERYGVDVLHPENSSLMQKANQFNADNPAPKKEGLLSSIGHVAKKIDNIINYPFAKAAQLSVPDANYFGTDINARQDFAQRNPITSTGNKTLDKVGDVAGGIGSLFTPIGTGGAFINDIGKGASALLASKSGQAAENLAGKLGAKSANLANPILNKIGVNLSTDLAQKSAQAALRGGALGASYGALEPFRTGEGNLSDVPKSVLENAAMFGVGDAALPFAGAGLGKIGELLKKQTPLPSYKGIDLKTNLGGEPKVVQNQPSNYINSFKNLTNTEDIHSGLNEINTHLAELESQYTQALDGQYKFLKDSLQNRQGVNQGGLINDASGDVTSRFGRTSNNPEWYQKFYKENGKVPTNKDLLNLAQQHVDNGFRDSGVDIPSWKDQVGYEDAKNSLTSVKNELNKSLSELNGKNSNVGTIPNVQKDIPINADESNPQPIKLTPKEQATQARIDQFSKVEDNPAIPDTVDQIQSKTGKESTPFSTKANQLYINTVDNAHRTNQFDQAAKKANGGILNPSDSAYTLQLNARGHDMQSSQIVNKNMINAQGEVTGQSLKDITAQIPKGQEQAFKDYVVAQHSIDRMGRGEQVYSADKNMTIQKAKEIVDRYNGTNPEFKNIQQQYTKFHQDFAQQWYVDTGLFKQEQINKAFEDNPNYVPNKRIYSDLEKKTPFGNSKGGAVGQTNPVKRYGEAGSKRPIVDPIESSIEDIAKGVKTAKNNEAGQAIVRSLQRNPEELKGFAEIVHDEPKLNIDEMLQKDGMEGVIDHINQTFEDATRKPNAEKGNVVTVLVHGEPVHIRVFDPQFLESISNLSPKGQDYVTNAVGKATKAMKTLTTGVNPVFGLTRNISRDIPHAFISSKTTSNPIRFGVDLLDSLTSVLADSMSHSDAFSSKIVGLARKVPELDQTIHFMKGWLETRGKLYNDYKNMGGGHSSSIAADRNLLAQSKEKILPSGGFGQTLKRNLLTKPYHMLENINNAAEASPRLGEYKRTIQQGLDQGKGLYDSKVKALYEANDVTTNFNKFGNVTKNADAYLPYLNAAVQGLDQLVRMGSQGGAKRLTQVYGKAIGALTIPTAVLYLINHNNPDYQQTSNFIKDNYLLIPNGDGTFKKIAKPRELGMIFSTGVERALRSFNDHDPKAFQDFGTEFLKNFLPPGAGGAVDGYNQKGLAGIPGGVMQDTIAGPLMDLERNKNFANQPIVPQDLLGLSPKNQYDAKTSEPAKFIGNLLNSSPKQLDFLAKSYLGVIGQLGIPATTKGGSIGDTLKQQVNVDPVFSNDISRNFYDQKTKADMAKADAKFTGVPQQQDMSAYYDKLATAFSKLRSQMKMIQKDDTISNTDKRAKLRELQGNLNKIQKDATR